MNTSLIDHPLVGTWIAEEDDSDVAFVISVEDNVFKVSGIYRSSGIPFDIYDVIWNGEALSFTARFQPTNTITKNVFRARTSDVADLALTVYEVWIKKEAKPGELPGAWRP
jgi:hypothetical protein